MSNPLTRRSFLQVTGLSLSAAAVSGCSVFSTDAKKPAAGTAVATDGAREAPTLAELVKTGKLPPLEQRLPKVPMVRKALGQPGKYGGILQRGVVDRNATQNQYNEWAGLVEWTPTTTKRK